MAVGRTGTIECDGGLFFFLPNAFFRFFFSPGYKANDKRLAIHSMVLV